MIFISFNLLIARKNYAREIGKTHIITAHPQIHIHLTHKDTHIHKHIHTNAHTKTHIHTHT